MKEHTLYESGEDYLETILVLSKSQEKVRAVDVARELGFSRASVSRAMNILKDEGLITVEGRSDIRLTDEGYRKAKDVYDRHTTLTEFLRVVAGVSEKTAETDACRIEHVISQTTFKGIKKFLKTYNKDNG